MSFNRELLKGENRASEFANYQLDQESCDLSRLEERLGRPDLKNSPPQDPTTSKDASSELV